MDKYKIKVVKSSTAAEAWLAEQFTKGYSLVSCSVTKEARGHLYHLTVERKK